ncbi:hypothetical protein OG728_38835 (plasmid) [Streptomyces microflavus]|uniref:hypothetical protein n=1 Tax=Streptomyces microflavus TaxID=1919 RepID=UPI002E13E049|nr:hypothetical protein OG728_38835 [Streptomyces microflavus]
MKPTTGLDLPDVVNFPIVTVETARATMSAEMAHLTRLYADLVPRWRRPFITLTSAVLLRDLHSRTPVLCEFLMMAATTTVPGTKESVTVFVPEALHHNGILTDDKYLTALVFHELVHQVQNRASRHRENWITNKAMTLLHAGGINFLEEGHAVWAEKIATRELYGTPVDLRDAPTSEQYNKHARRGASTAGPVGPSLDTYQVGRLLVASAVETGGLESFNLVWTDHQMLPNKDEVAEARTCLAADEHTRPQGWASRLQRKAASRGVSATD